MLEQKQERAAALPREAEKKAIKALQKELAALQQPLRAAGVPVLLVFEGWSAAGKGSMIAKVISEMDPRGYQVYSAAEPTDEEARRPLLWPFWRELPPRGGGGCAGSKLVQPGVGADGGGARPGRGICGVGEHLRAAVRG